jgi:hypothetical protein
MEYYSVGNGQDQLKDELQTPDNKKFVLLKLPEFSEVLIKSSGTASTLVSSFGAASENANFRTLWTQFFGPAPALRSLSG